MCQRGSGRSGLVERKPVLLVDENLLDGAIAIGAQPLRAVTRRLEAIGAMEPAQSHQPQARAVALLGVRPCREDAGDQPPRGGAALFRPRDQPGRGPFGMRPMGPRHVLTLRNKSAAAAEARMRCDAPSVEEDFDGRLRDARFHARVHELIRHAVLAVHPT